MHTGFFGGGNLRERDHLEDQGVDEKTQSSDPEDGQNNCPKHVELTEIINNPLLLHLGGCL